MQKWWGKRNVWLEIWCNSYAYFLCHCGVSIPQIVQGSMMVSFRFTQFTKTSLCRASKTPWACGKTPNKWSEFCGDCRKVWQGHLDFHEIHWMILEGWPPFFLGVQTSLIWLKCFVWNGRWWIVFWWNVGKLLEVNATTSLTLECRAFTVRFFTRDRSSLRQRMTFYLCSSHLEVEILNHVDLTPRFLDVSTMTLMFFVLMVEILAFDQVSRMLSLSICFVCHPIRYPIRHGRTMWLCFFSWREPHEPQEWLFPWQV